MCILTVAVVAVATKCISCHNQAGNTLQNKQSCVALMCFDVHERLD